MKKIYSFTLDSDEYASSRRNIYNDIRLIAYMLYNEIYSYCDSGDDALNVNPLIEYNNLRYNSLFDFCYNFDSDIVNDKYTYYEPFIVGNRTFCFTIYDDKIDEKDIKYCLDYVLRLLKLKYKVTINKYEYKAKDINDEKYRDEAICKIFSELGYKSPIKTGLIPTIIKCGSMKKRVRNNKRIAYRYY